MGKRTENSMGTRPGHPTPEVGRWQNSESLTEDWAAGDRTNEVPLYKIKDMTFE